jgi:hypothetical protein
VRSRPKNRAVTAVRAVAALGVLLAAQPAAFVAATVVPAFVDLILGGA